MQHSGEDLRARRVARQHQLKRRRRLVAVGLLAGAGAITAVIALTAGSNSVSRTGGDSKAAASAARPAQATAAASEDWMKPLATPAQQAAAVKRIAATGKPVYCGGGRGRYVALTFDDGPGAYTHFALKKLKQWKVRATFFLIGRLLEEPAWQGWARREVPLAAIGNHSWTHPYLPGLDAASIRSQVADTTAKAAQVTGAPVGVFRPPYGARNATVDGTARTLGLAQIIWDVDSLDSQGANWAGITRNVNAGLKPGAIILMHENRGQTIRALPGILPQLRKRRLTAVTVPELLALDPPSSRQLAAGPNGCGALRGKA